MKTTSKMTTWGVLAALAAASVSPALADGSQSRADQQNNKNTMRNLGIAGAAVATIGLLNHNNTLTLLGAAGAALAGSQYEKDRQQQSQDNGHFYFRDGRNPNTDWNRANRDKDQNQCGPTDRSDFHR
jgi:hypothetical protein